MVRLAGSRGGEMEAPLTCTAHPQAAFLRNSSQGRMEVGGQVSPWESRDDTLPLQGLQVRGHQALSGGAGGAPSPCHSPSEAPLRTTEEGPPRTLSLLPTLSLSIARAHAHTHEQETEAVPGTRERKEAGRGGTLLSEEL